MAPRTVKNPARKAKAVDRFTTLAKERDKAEAFAKIARHKLFRATIPAYNAGLTYSELARIVGVSEARIAQIMTEERERRAT